MCGGCLAHGILDSALSEIESVETGPVRRIQKLAKISKRERRGDRALLDGLRGVGTKDLERRRSGGALIRVCRVFTGSAAEPEVAMGRKLVEEVDKCMILRREEIRIRELRALVRQTNEFLGDRRMRLHPADFQGRRFRCHRLR